MIDESKSAPLHSDEDVDDKLDMALLPNYRSVLSGDQLIQLIPTASGRDITSVRIELTKLVLDNPPSNKAEVTTLTLKMSPARGCFYSTSALLSWMMKDSQCILLNGAKRFEAARKASVYLFPVMVINRDPNGAQCSPEARRYDLSAAFWIALSREVAPSPNHIVCRLMEISGMLHSLGELTECEDTSDLRRSDVAHFFTDSQSHLHDNWDLALEPERQRLFVCRSKGLIQTELQDALFKVFEWSKQCGGHAADADLQPD